MERITIHITGWLPALLKRQWQEMAVINYPSQRRASIKDIIEALGIPHTEVGKITTDGEEQDFHFIPEGGEAIIVKPQHPPVDPRQATLLRPTPLIDLKFLADHNVAKLASKLRMMGIDCGFNNAWHDQELAKKTQTEKRILLSRDIALLKRKQVVFGHFVRETVPDRQLAEIIHFYNLGLKLAPFSRCMRCNTRLVDVDKSEVIHLLEPLTKKYYHTFRQCPGCSQIYWQGSHREKMAILLEKLSSYQPLFY
jgi:uncharacterized protein with PIN domain